MNTHQGASPELIGSSSCPCCGHELENKPDWLGLPAGVKFDPTDQEMIEHLQAKVKSGASDSHPLIDEFIPTIEGEDGICYTHPEKLPGVTRDGLSRHFFHRPSKAYTTGTRKRRKIQSESDLQGGETRWHKTGKTRPVMVNGRQRGCKKILVLYTNFGKNRKPEKTNWVMHQYHLGEQEEEKEGELVVSKVFFQTQPRQCTWSAAPPDRVGAAAMAGAEGVEQPSGSSSSCREVVIHGGDQMSSPGVRMAYGGLETGHHHVKPGSDYFGFAPLLIRRSFDEVGMGEVVTAAMATDTAPQTCEEESHAESEQRRRAAAAILAFHVNSRPGNPISAILPPGAALHQASAVLEDSYQQRPLLLQNQKIQLQQAEEHQRGQKSARTASGLEEMIMGCTSGPKGQDASIPNSQEAEWLKYSYWPDPDNPDYHG